MANEKLKGLFSALNSDQTSDQGGDTPNLREIVQKELGKRGKEATRRIVSDIPESLHRKFAIKCREDGVTQSAVLELLVRLYVEGD